MAPRVGLEPTTLRLTAECSAVELSGNQPRFERARKYYTHPVVIRKRDFERNTAFALFIRVYSCARDHSSMVEQGTHNPLAAGSNPAGPTIETPGQTLVRLAFPFAWTRMHELVYDFRTGLLHRMCPDSVMNSPLLQ